MYLHHIEMWVKNRKPIMKIFQNFGFYLKACRKTSNVDQHVITNNYVDVLISSPNETTKTNYTELSPLMAPLSSICPKNNSDTVYNVCLEVENVMSMTDKMCKYGGKCLINPTVVSDTFGDVNYAIVATGFGNIIHTLVDKSKYKGLFLPGFSMNSQNIPTPKKPVVNHIDHVTYVCHPGQSEAIMEWYRKCFGSERISFETEDNYAIVIEENINIRLKAAKMSTENKELFRLVVGEPLANNSQNHIQVFLEEHGGPGIEHIAFHTNDIVQTMQELHQNLTFRPIPASYYDTIEIDEKLRIKSEDLKSLGILIDTEQSNYSEKKNYLLQTFTSFALAEKTFFFEIIQRVGAEGFGAKNIINIMRAIEKDMMRVTIS
ncbi:hypothetical protein CHUAL_006988 [Chamberlinius hualienensis]